MEKKDKTISSKLPPSTGQLELSVKLGEKSFQLLVKVEIPLIQEPIGKNPILIDNLTLHHVQTRAVERGVFLDLVLLDKLVYQGPNHQLFYIEELIPVEGFLPVMEASLGQIVDIKEIHPFYEVRNSIRGSCLEQILVVNLKAELYEQRMVNLPYPERLEPKENNQPRLQSAASKLPVISVFYRKSDNEVKSEAEVSSKYVENIDETARQIHQLQDRVSELEARIGRNKLEHLYFYRQLTALKKLLAKRP